jgi:3-hydroxyacyl-CoA dehydrogenase
MPSPWRHDLSRPAIAVLGTGRMGAPIARNLLAAGFEVSVWNRTAERAAPLAADGARLSSRSGRAAASERALLPLWTTARRDVARQAHPPLALARDERASLPPAARCRFPTRASACRWVARLQVVSRNDER